MSQRLRQAAARAAKAAASTSHADRVRIFKYGLGIGTFMLGMGYAFVPLYQIFCRTTGYAGATIRSDEKKLSKARKYDGNRHMDVLFEAAVDPGMNWEFKPAQDKVRVKLGEPTLAFFTAKNLTDKAMVGLATYNVIPAKAGYYFHKIQCFCFDEQRLRAGEEIDMPVFFYLDPKLDKDKFMDMVEDVTLSYQFHDIENDEEEEEFQQQIAEQKRLHEELQKQQNQS